MSLQSRTTAVAAVLILSLTLGAGAAILALVDAVLLTPPPFADPDSLVVLSEVPTDEPSGTPRRATYGTFEAWREAAGAMASLEAVDGANLTLTGLGPAERVSSNDVTTGFLRQLGVSPSLGRTFEPTDAGQPVVIVSDHLWREKMNADPNVIGRAIVLGGVSHTIVGVLPRPSRFDPTAADFWRPIPQAITPAFRSSYLVTVYARLAPNVSSTALNGALDPVSRLSSPRARVVVTPIGSVAAGDAGRTLGVLAAAAVIAALLAFVNIGGLLVVRSIARQRELAIRSALGARPWVITRQMLIETQGLVLLGIAGGSALAMWITAPFARLSLAQFAGADPVAVPVNWQVIAVVAVLASIGGALCTLPSAIAASRRDLVDTLRRGATPPPRELLLRRMFVAVQVSLAFVLLASVTLVGGTLRQLLKASPGFATDGVLLMKLSLPSASYADERIVSFYSTLQTSLEDRLGRGSIAAVNEVPLDGSLSRRALRLHPDDAGREAVVREVTAGYFEVMRIPLIAGRAVDGRDNRSAARRVVISESLASMLGLSNPVGQKIWYSRTEPAEIMGLVGDVKHQILDESLQPTLYLPAAQSPSRSMVLVTRNPRPVSDVVAAVREEVARLDSSLPVYGIAALSDIVARSRGMRERRVITATFIGFAVLAIVLASVGLLAVSAHDVLSRRKEIALRMAIGASPSSILAGVLRQAAATVVAGALAGAMLSIWINGALVATGFAAVRFTWLAVGVPFAIVAIAGVVAVIPAVRSALTSDPVSLLTAGST